MTKIEISLPAELAAQLAAIDKRLERMEGRLQKETEWLNTKEAAELLGISEGTLRSRAKNGEIQSHRNGKNFRFKRDEITQE